MSNPGMDADVFEQFIEQLQRYVRDRLLPAEKEIIESDEIPDDIPVSYTHLVVDKRQG